MNVNRCSGCSASHTLHTFLKLKANVYLHMALIPLAVTGCSGWSPDTLAAGAIGRQGDALISF
jgi:hypothetical protein